MVREKVSKPSCVNVTPGILQRLELSGERLQRLQFECIHRQTLLAKTTGRGMVASKNPRTNNAKVQTATEKT